MKNEQTLTTQESLQIIEAMVGQARFNFSRNAGFFIIWGGLLFGAATFELMGKQLGLTYFFVGWPLAGMVGGLASWAYGSRMERLQGHQTALDRIYSAIWTVYLITLAMLIPALVFNSIDPNGFVMLLTGFPTVLTGSVLRYKPLLFGGSAFWVGGLLALTFLPQFATHLMALCLVLGYIVPGMIMWRNKQ